MCLLRRCESLNLDTPEILLILLKISCQVTRSKAAVLRLRRTTNTAYLRIFLYQNIPTQILIIRNSNYPNISGHLNNLNVMFDCRTSARVTALHRGRPCLRCNFKVSLYYVLTKLFLFEYFFIIKIFIFIIKVRYTPDNMMIEMILYMIAVGLM